MVEKERLQMPRSLASTAGGAGRACVGQSCGAGWPQGGHQEGPAAALGCTVWALWAGPGGPAYPPVVVATCWWLVCELKCGDEGLAGRVLAQNCHIGQSSGKQAAIPPPWVH